MSRLANIARQQPGMSGNKKQLAMADVGVVEALRRGVVIVVSTSKREVDAAICTVTTALGLLSLRL